MPGTWRDRAPCFFTKTTLPADRGAKTPCWHPGGGWRRPKTSVSEGQLKMNYNNYIFKTFATFLPFNIWQFTTCTFLPWSISFFLIPDILLRLNETHGSYENINYKLRNIKDNCYCGCINVKCCRAWLEKINPRDFHGIWQYCTWVHCTFKIWN